jgi:hypothetical protein
MSARRALAPLACTLALCAGFASVAAPAAGSGAGHAASDAPAPLLETMVVGIGGRVFAPARVVSAASASVRVGHRSCEVAAATPLAVLAALAQSGGPRFLLRDYGDCGSAPASSSELFVYSIGGERNRGQDGWEYKVGNLGGSTGAADPSGPQGNGARLRSGEQVLWFWCVASESGCERTLAVNAPATSPPGPPLHVTVRAYDNEGRPAPAAGARVTLGSSSVTTGSDGEASIAAPATSGRYALAASASGDVPSFPRALLVQ